MITADTHWRSCHMQVACQFSKFEVVTPLPHPYLMRCGDRPYY